MDDFLSVKNLSVSFDIRGGLLMRKVATVNAVNDVSFTLKRGETIGIVGESGCGKTTLARMLMRLVVPSSGSIFLKGEDLLALSKKEMKAKRSQLQMVFQDPYSVFDPRYTIYRSLNEPFRIRNVRHSRQEKKETLDSLLKLVGLPTNIGNAYPHQISGGQKQRADIARALALRPELLVLDEPTASLDVSVQAQVIKLLEDLREQLDLTYVFISHDLSLVSYFCNRIIVMYMGNVMEILDAEDVGSRSAHPYTRALIANIPRIRSDAGHEKLSLEGEPPSPLDVPRGCAFSARCPFAKPVCQNEKPPLVDSVAGGKVACHFPLF